MKPLRPLWLRGYEELKAESAPPRWSEEIKPVAVLVRARLRLRRTPREDTQTASRPSGICGYKRISDLRRTPPHKKPAQANQEHVKYKK